MVKGIHLTLMIGPAVPVPVPKEILDALTSVEVMTSAGKDSAFQLNFTLSNKSPLHTLFLLSGGTVLPIIRVVIIATVGGIPEVLIDGVMTHHEITGSESGHSTLVVTGEDLTRLMDYIDFSGIPYPAMPAEARVALILAKYAMFGIIPFVVPSFMMDIPLPISRIPRHQGKDLGYIRQLADEAGYVFYLEPGPAPGMSIGYWGPELKVGIPQPALNVNMDVHTNVESLNFSYNPDHKVMPVIYIYNEATKIPIPIPVPDVSPLNPPLGLVPPIPKNIEPMNGTAKLSPVRAILSGMAKAAKTSDVVSASGSLDVLRYGRALKARRLVGVRGAGPAFDGLYFIKSVRHQIKRGEYKQNFELTRNGLLSTLPAVPV